MILPFDGWFSSNEAAGLGDFWRVYDRSYDALNELTLAVALEDPHFGPIIRAMSADQLADQQRKSRTLLQRAMAGDWADYAADLQVQGVTYAELGVGYTAWYRLVRAASRELTPLVFQEYGTDSARLRRAVLAMNSFFDWVMARIGEAYLDAKQRLVRDREEDLEITLNSIGDGVIATDAQGLITKMNPVAAQLTGWSPADAKGRPLDEVFEIISDQTRAAADNPAARVLREGTIVGLANHTTLIARDGTERPIADSAAPIRDGKGAVTGVVLVFHDMTAERAIERKLRRSEQRFRRLFESGILGIIVADLVGNIRDANEAFLSMFGYTSDDLSAGRVRWSEMTPPRWQARDAKAVEELATGGVCRSYEKEYFHKDGSVVPILLGAAMIEGSDECICYIVDLTERKRAEHAIQVLNAELELRVEQRTEQLRQLNRELESFSYSVAHDLRAPLRGIAGFAQVLADDYADKLDDEGKDCVAEIHGNAARMALLIDALLSLSRVNRTDLHPAKVDLGALVRDVAGALGRSEPRSAIEWVVGADLVVEIDPLLARTLVENLVGNAWKFTRDVAAPRIEVGSRREDRTIVVFVRDNGVGFDMKYVDKLFTPFQRLHTSTEFPGTGIGLANIQRIIKRHGGKVWAEGAVGTGATFFVQLPEHEGKQ